MPISSASKVDPSFSGDHVEAVHSNIVNHKMNCASPHTRLTTDRNRIAVAGLLASANPLGAYIAAM